MPRLARVGLFLALGVFLSCGTSICICTSAHAGTANEFQTWTTAVISKRPQGDTGWAGAADLQIRHGQDQIVLLVRPALGYQLSPALAAYLGYAWVPTFQEVGPTRHEHDLWEQVLWAGHAGHGAELTLRPRLEQRVSTAGDGVGHRLRLYARTSALVAMDKPLMLVLWDEALWQFNDTAWGLHRGFDQNRVFAGVGLPASAALRLELAYLNCFQNRTPDNRELHALAVGMYYRY